jgi:parallel beta-helix repeat protein
VIGTNSRLGYVSSDGVSWKRITIGTAARGLCYYEGLWIATGLTLWTSKDKDAVIWKQRLKLSDLGRTKKENLYSCVGAPSFYIAAGEHGLMFNSKDGINWTQRDSGTKRFILGMAFGKDVVAAVGNGGHRRGKPDSLYLHCVRFSPPDDAPDGGGGGGKSITIISPNGGEDWQTGSTHDITWESSGGVGNVKLEYSVDNGKNWIVFDAKAKNDGIREWVVPDTPSNMCKIRISEVVEPAISGTGNKVFKISKTEVASIGIMSPNGGENWEVGSMHDITWKSSGKVGNVKLEYSVDNGKTWIVFDSVAKNDGIRPWLVPNTPSDKCSIRISSVANPATADTSDTTFTIVEPSKIIPVSPGTNKISEAVLELEQGGVVELGVGTYTQSEPIILPTDVTVFSIKGRGLGATIIECSDCNGIERAGAGIIAGVQQCDISGLTLIASKSNNKHTGIELHGDGPDQTGNPNIIIRDVGFEAGDGNSSWDKAIHIINASAPLIENIHIKGTDGLKGVGIELEGCAAAVAAGGNLGQLDEAVNIRDCTKVKLANMDISVVNKGVTLARNTRHVMVNNCNIEPVKRYALHEQKSMDEGTAGYHVINGGCYGFSPDAKELSHLVWLQNDGSEVNGIIANGNGTNTNGLTIRAKLRSGVGPVNGIRINGCMLRNLTTGIYLLNGKECTVTGNICENTANGIFIGKGSQNNKLVANIGSITDQGKDNQVI